MKFFFLSCFIFINLLCADEGDVPWYNPYSFTHEDVLAEDNNSKRNYIDAVQDVISGKVHEWSVDVDNAILDTYTFFADENRSEQEITLQKDKHDYNLSKKLEQRPKREIVDDLFLTRRMLEERDKSYVRVSFVQRYNSLENEDSRFNIRARLKLGRSQDRFKLFIEDFNDESAKNIGQANEENSPSIGVEKKSKKIFGIRPRYSVGFRGIYPFVRARFNYDTNFGIWHFEPVQTFVYSTKYEFSEQTDFYLDTPTSEKTLLRFVVDRGTQSHVDGMRYDAFVQWFYSPRKYRGLSFNLGFNGQTQYQEQVGDIDLYRQESKNKVFNYLFLMRWRENIFRKWFFYEIGPGVNYHKIHDYRPNYNIYFGIDLFFGHV